MNLQKITHPGTSHPSTRLRSYAPHGGFCQTSLPQKMPQKKPDPFASALAHEVRNPLSNINLAAEMLKSSNRDPEQKMFLDIILRNSARINSLITDLLVSYQADEMHPGEHSLHQLLDEVLAQTGDRILLKKILVSKNYASQDFKILVNKQKMKIALTNIIINAIDAMPPENGKLNLATKWMDGNCVVEIEDNGSGISKENLAHIFKPYFTGKVGGMGLGLSTTLNILQSDHVSVDVESEEKRGTRFVLSFGGMHLPRKSLHQYPHYEPFTVMA